jgi:predicted small secreted protein
MKKTSILAVFIALGMMMSGCSKTWNGVKQDSSDAWNASKKAVHEATA